MKAILVLVATGAFFGYAFAQAADPVPLQSPVVAEKPGQLGSAV